MTGRTNTAARRKASGRDLAIIEKALETLYDFTHWTKGAPARDPGGIEVSVDDKMAFSFDLAGAVNKEVLEEEEGFVERRFLLERCLSILYSHIPSGEHDTVTDFNDHPDTTYRDVVSVLRSAINYSEEQRT